jgi:DNA-binding IclR family transcriptional regulator
MSDVKSADRVCSILALLAQTKEGLKHGEIASSLHIPSSSASSLLFTLSTRGFVSLDSIGRRYRLGPEILSLAGLYLESLDIVEISRPVVKRLAMDTGESAALGVRNGWEILILCKEDSPQLIKRTMQIGERSPMHASACGKIILAYMHPQEYHHYLSSVPLEAITPRTITDPTILQKELQEIRSIGIAYNREEKSEQIIAIAAPIYDLYGNVNAALVVSFPTSRTSPDKEKSFEQIIRDACRTVSEKLGFRGDPVCRVSGNPSRSPGYPISQI